LKHQEIVVNEKSHGNDGRKGNYENHDSHSSHEQRPIIPPRGDYQTLLSYQKAEVVYDITFRFVHKFLSKGDRTVDQMIQSARSFVQAEHSGRQQGGDDIEGNGNQTDKRRPGQSGRTAGRFSRLPASPRPYDLGKRFQRSLVCA